MSAKLLATMQDFLIIHSFTIMFIKVLFQERFSIKCHLPIVPSGVSYYKSTYMADREFIHTERGRGWYLPHLHTIQLYIHVLLQIQVGACCMMFRIANYHPNAISNSLKKCSLDLLYVGHCLGHAQLSFQREEIHLLLYISSYPKLELPQN